MIPDSYSLAALGRPFPVCRTVCTPSVTCPSLTARRVCLPGRVRGAAAVVSRGAQSDPAAGRHADHADRRRRGALSAGAGTHARQIRRLRLQRRRQPGLRVQQPARRQGDHERCVTVSWGPGVRRSRKVRDGHLGGPRVREITKGDGHQGT